MDLDAFKTLGLTQGEIRVYSTILSTGITNLNTIHEKTGMERRAIYDIINKLIEKGLITYLEENGKRTYRCAPPSKLKDEVARIKKDVAHFESLLPLKSEGRNRAEPTSGISSLRISSRNK